MSPKPSMDPPMTARRFETASGGGAFGFSRLSIGVFLVDQPTHRIALGSDKREAQPLAAQKGWILPAGVEGVCEFDDPHAFLAVELSDALLIDAGFDPRRGMAPHIGAHDPLLLQMALSAGAPPPGAPTLYRDAMNLALAAHLVQLAQPAPTAAAAIDDARLRRAVAFVDDNLARDLSLAELASEAAMSPFHFSRAFKQATGRSPLRFVIDARLDRAMTLLRTTASPVAEIAHRVGYGDVSRFNRHFKRRFGGTPGAARGSA